MKLRLNHTLLMFITLLALKATVYGQVKPTTNRPAKEPYASMSATDKLKIQKKLVAQLKADSDFIAIEKITKDIFDETVKLRAKVGKGKPIDRNSNSPEAKKMRDGMYDAMIRNIQLMKKYPEIGQLDSETRRAIYNEARTKKAS